MSRYQEIISESIAALELLREMEKQFHAAAEMLSQTLADGKKILVCGNGGSAADAAHFATELLCRFENDRRALPAIALTVDGTFLTATGNDYGFEQIFSRQVEGLGQPGDALVGITTSGNSENVLHAFTAAKNRGVKSLAMLGRNGGRAAGIADFELTVPSPSTARIQEAQIVLIHALCEEIERRLGIRE